MKKLIKEILHTMEEIYDGYRKYSINPVAADWEEGWQLSKKIISQEDDVPITPIMKNILKKFDPSLDRLKVKTPKTKGEVYVNNYVEKRLIKRFGPRQVDYERQAIFSDRNLAVDNWRNFKDTMRHIQPGQSKGRHETISKFYNKTAISYQDMVSLISNDLVLQKAIEVVFDELPRVKANKDITEVSVPFMTKHTNVSFPYWRNDRAIAPNGQTYAQLTLDIAKKLKVSDIHRYNVATLYGRNQRGKGRAIIAASRIPTLVLNRLEAVEIAAYKAKSPLFIGYGDDSDLKNGLIKIAKFCLNGGYECENFDYSKFDSTVSEGFILLLGAISMLKSVNQDSKQLAYHRTLTMLTTLLLSGYDSAPEPKRIYGRIFSGHIDTNRGGGIINAIAATYSLMKQSETYTEDIAYKAPVRMMVMGDDNICILPKGFSHQKFVDTLATLGFTVHPDKGEYGVFFLQNRLVKARADDTILRPTLHDFKMTYPWTRVLMSTLFKENSMGLGPFGWTIAIWQQLSKLIEDRESLIDILPILVENDEFGLHLDTPITTITSGLTAEDKEATKGKVSKRSNMSTAKKLFDGDPTKASFYKINPTNGEISFNDSYLGRLQRILRSAYQDAKGRIKPQEGSNSR